MKQLISVLVVLLLAGCSGGKSKRAVPTPTNPISFNGFRIGTSLDTLAKHIPTQPYQRLDDELDYLDIAAEGVHWDTITYQFVGGQLARATATQVSKDVGSYRKLAQFFTERYGKPAQQVDSLTIWARWDAELSLQPGTLLFSRR